MTGTLRTPGDGYVFPYVVLGQYLASAPSYSNGEFSTFQTDQYGNLKVYVASQGAGEDVTNNVQGVVSKVVVASTYSPSTYHSAKSGALVVQDNIKLTAGNLVSLRAANANTTTIRYLWITNSATSPANALASSDNTVKHVYTVFPSSAMELGTDEFTTAGEYFSTGISWGFSTSATAFTPATASEHTVNADYY